MAILGLAVFLASDSAILADPNLGQLQGRCVAAFMLKQHSSDSRNFRLMTPRTSRLNSLEKEGVLLWARQAGIFHRCCGWCCCGRYSSHCYVVQASGGTRRSTSLDLKETHYISLHVITRRMPTDGPFCLEPQSSSSLFSFKLPLRSL